MCVKPKFVQDVFVDMDVLFMEYTQLFEKSGFRNKTPSTYDDKMKGRKNCGVTYITYALLSSNNKVARWDLQALSTCVFQISSERLFVDSTV